MFLSIKERIISLRSTYDIVSPDGKTYTAEKKIFSLFPNLKIVEAGGQEVVNLKGGFALFSQKYDFVFADGRTYHYKTESRLKPVYLAEGNGEAVPSLSPSRRQVLRLQGRNANCRDHQEPSHHRLRQ